MMRNIALSSVLPSGEDLKHRREASAVRIRSSLLHTRVSELYTSGKHGTVRINGKVRQDSLTKLASHLFHVRLGDPIDSTAQEKVAWPWPRLQSQCLPCSAAAGGGTGGGTGGRGGHPPPLPVVQLGRLAATNKPRTRWPAIGGCCSAGQTELSEIADPKRASGQCALRMHVNASKNIDMQRCRSNMAWGEVRAGGLRPSMAQHCTSGTAATHRQLYRMRRFVFHHVMVHECQSY